MAAIPQKVLNWLHSVIVNEYRDVPRTYNDAVQALSQYQTIRPRTDVYTFENGRSCLLLQVTGTLPVQFRGATYSFPISLWVPQEYPREGPIAFVTPTNEMSVRPGQHVSGEGRIYHPYLANWRPDRSNISEFLQNLQDVFSREPPVVSKYEQMARPQGQTNSAPPAVPPKPGRSTIVAHDRPPPPPPKPFEGPQTQANSRPPLPPQPEGQVRDGRLQGNQPNDYVPNPNDPQRMRQYGSRIDPYSPDPNSWQPTVQQSPIPHGVNRFSPHSSIYTYQPSSSQEPRAQYDYQGPPPPPMPGGAQRHSSTSSQPLQRQYPTNYPHQGQNYQLPPRQTPISQQQHQQTQQQPRIPKPPEDLLSSPFDNPLPLNSQPSDIPAPPIPSNPEKDALLSAISQTLTQQLHSTLTSHATALPPLRAQRTALESTLQNMQQEHQALTSLQSLLSSNEAILHTAMRDADACIENAKHRTVPPVDEVLVAPTVVGEQLYNLVAEERACEEARAVLGRALDKDRIGVDAWVKHVRGLAREEFLKKVLIKKCAKGLGLREEERWD